MKTNCEFVSVWDGGQEIRTPAFFDTRRRIVVTDAVEAPDVECLEREYLDMLDCVEIEICTTCHEHPLRCTMENDSVGKGLHEVYVCEDPDCPSRR